MTAKTQQSRTVIVTRPVPGACPRPVRTRDLRDERPPDPEAEIAESERRGESKTMGRAEERWTVDPGTPAHDMAAAISVGPCGAIRRRAVVAVMVAILHPLEHIAGH